MNGRLTCYELRLALAAQNSQLICISVYFSPTLISVTVGLK